MDDGFECSCPAEYKGPTCEGKHAHLNVTFFFQRIDFWVINSYIATISLQPGNLISLDEQPNWQSFQK